MLTARRWLVLAVATAAVVATGFGAAKASNELTYPKAAVLGVVEGVTEYLPVSSTGHLVVAERLMGIGQTDATKTATDTYTIAIQLGAIVAVLAIYWRRCLSVANGLIGRDPDGRRTLIALALAFLPAGVIAKVFEGPIKDVLLEPIPVAIAWIVGGVVILAWFRRHVADSTARITSIADIQSRHALMIGVAQSLALCPGVSRSLVTIIGALLLGCSMSVALEFSFLLGLLTLSAATAYALVTDGADLVDTFGVAAPLFGAVVAGVAAFASVKWMIAYLQRRGLGVFGWYRVAAGVSVLAGAAAGTSLR